MSTRSRAMTIELVDVVRMCEWYPLIRRWSCGCDTDIPTDGQTGGYISGSANVAENATESSETYLLSG